MSRDTSLTFRQAINARETGEAFIIFVEISNSPGQTDLSESILVCNNSVDTISNGSTYVAYPFDLTLPDDVEDGVPTCRLTIDHVARELTVGIRSLTGPPAVRIMVALASDPDTIEVDFPYFKLVNVSYDSLTIEGDISIEGYMNEPYPGDSFGPSNFPGLF